MGEPAIRVEGLGKRYRLAHGQERGSYRTLRESVMNFVANPFKGKGSVEEFWALKDVSFEVQPGEVVGIIGRNGAGKSTLLKVLSRITKPTTGRVEINGRVGSLLEVGTGFHPELTGRENIYLNGSILGMSRKEIDRKFDEIVAFAEVEKFLDTPVKRYSSGMYVRLAFAVAAHLEPEILIVDEVLAVGDQAFQEKCLGMMRAVSQSGRTILFVSHNLGALARLCKRGLVLGGGVVLHQEGPIGPAVDFYLRRLRQSAGTPAGARTDRVGGQRSRITEVRISDGRTGGTGPLVVGRPVRFEFNFSELLTNMGCAFSIYNAHGDLLANFNSKAALGLVTWEGRPQFICDISELLLVPGDYRINVALFADGEQIDHLEAAATFQAADGVVAGRRCATGDPGIFYLPASWSHAQE